MSAVLSIIIPVYNVSAYLSRCLDSVLPLLSGEVEIIVVNDGSTDESLNILNKYSAQYDSLIVISQVNSGLSAARNAGLKLAKGEYIWFIDGDDYIDLEELSPIYDVIRRNGKIDMIVFGRVEDWGSSRKKTLLNMQREIYETGYDYLVSAIKKRTFRTNVWDKLYRKEILVNNDIYFIEGLLYEDMNFLLRALLCSNLVYSFPLYPYCYVRYNTLSITVQLREKDLDVLRFVHLTDDFLREKQYPLKVDSYIYNTLIFRWVSSCLLKKYLPLLLSNSVAKEIVQNVLQDKSFRRAVSIIRNKGGVKERIMALCINYTPLLYCLVIVLYLKLRR